MGIFDEGERTEGVYCGAWIVLVATGVVDFLDAAGDVAQGVVASTAECAYLGYPKDDDDPEDDEVAAHKDEYRPEACNEWGYALIGVSVASFLVHRWASYQMYKIYRDKRPSLCGDFDGEYGDRCSERRFIWREKKTVSMMKGCREHDKRITAFKRKERKEPAYGEQQGQLVYPEDYEETTCGEKAKWHCLFQNQALTMTWTVVEMGVLIQTLYALYTGRGAKPGSADGNVALDAFARANAITSVVSIILVMARFYYVGYQAAKAGKDVFAMGATFFLGVWGGLTILYFTSSAISLPEGGKLDGDFGEAKVYRGWTYAWAAAAGIFTLMSIYAPGMNGAYDLLGHPNPSTKNGQRRIEETRKGLQRTFDEA